TTISPTYHFPYYRDPRALPSFPTRRSSDLQGSEPPSLASQDQTHRPGQVRGPDRSPFPESAAVDPDTGLLEGFEGIDQVRLPREDRKSTRLNSSHEWISYAVFCLKKQIQQY